MPSGTIRFRRKRTNADTLNIDSIIQKGIGDGLINVKYHYNDSELKKQEEEEEEFQQKRNAEAREASTQIIEERTAAADTLNKKELETVRAALLNRANEREKENKSRKKQNEENFKIAREQRIELEEEIAELQKKLQGELEDEERTNYEKQLEEAQGALGEAKAAENSAESKKQWDDIGGAIGKQVSKALSGMLSKIDSSIEEYEKYYTDINTRTQGAFEDMDFESLSSSIQAIVGYSPYVKFDDVLESLDKLVEAGTAVNLEQRAFLDTVSDKVASTFDALDSNLLRIIRLQQDDTTASRLGMEASLTRLFNYYFSDTSYLADAFDSVTAALMGLTSSLDAQSGVEYEYVIQKWLGALGSEGADTSTLTSLANAINALSIGDISALSSDQGMQNLIIMAANRMGLDYSEMLVNTPTVDELNKLMYGIIEYIQEIMSDANNVVKNQYADLFGITYTDIRAFENLNQEMMDELYQSVMTYNDTLEELDDQLTLVRGRTSIGEMMDNVIDNVFSEAAMSMFNSAALYGTYAAAGALESVTGGINISTIGVLGNFVGIANSVEELMQIGVAGMGLLTSVISAIGNASAGNTGALDLSKWNITYSKGEYTGYTSAAMITDSSSNVGTISNTSSTGIQQSIYDEQVASGEEISGTSTTAENEMLTVEKEILDYLLDGGSSTNPLRVRTTSTYGYGESYASIENISTEGTTAGNSTSDLSELVTQVVAILEVLQNNSSTNPVFTSNIATEESVTSIEKLMQEGRLPSFSLGNQ